MPGASWLELRLKWELVMEGEEPSCYLLSVLVRVSIAVAKCHDQKASWGRKGLFGLHFHIAVFHRRKSGQELKLGGSLEVGADVVAMEGCYSLACSSWLV